MIRLTDRPFTDDCAYSARICALHNTYKNAPFAFFWQQENGDEITAAIAKIDGDVTLFATENADYEELAVFLETVGYSTVSCNEAVMKKLGFSYYSSSFLVEYKNPQTVSADGIVRADYAAVYSLLKECDFSLPATLGDFLADFAARCNHSAADYGCILEGDKLASTASALFIGEKSVLLGAVATAKDCRGKGYAAKIVAALADKYYLSGKRVYLFCREDSLEKFYTRIGFEVIGKWSVKER